jgi:hypothetical protein
MSALKLTLASDDVGLFPIPKQTKDADGSYDPVAGGAETALRYATESA